MWGTGPAVPSLPKHILSEMSCCLLVLFFDERIKKVNAKTAHIAHALIRRIES